MDCRAQLQETSQLQAQGPAHHVDHSEGRGRCSPGSQSGSSAQHPTCCSAWDGAVPEGSSSEGQTRSCWEACVSQALPSPTHTDTEPPPDSSRHPTRPPQWEQVSLRPAPAETLTTAAKPELKSIAREQGGRPEHRDPWGLTPALPLPDLLLFSFPWFRLWLSLSSTQVTSNTL